MAKITEANNGREYHITEGSDMFIQCETGDRIKIGIRRDGIFIQPINGIKMALGVENGDAGVWFWAPKEIGD